VLLCANLPHPGPPFRQALLAALSIEAQTYAQSLVGIVETLVIRIAPAPPDELRARDPLLVWTNGYPELPVDRGAFKGVVPAVPGLRPVADMRAEETRKLYTYNTFHAALAYLGALEGYKLIAQCMADPDVRDHAAQALDEAARAVQAEYGFESEDMSRWVEDVIRHTDNPVLGDTVQRYGADPARKLRRQDRLVGPTLLARVHGLDHRHLTRAIAAALHFDLGDAQVREQIERLGLPAAVSALCGLTEAEQDLAEQIVHQYRS
jgi:mannitol-1-phosphate 5-dehydrogenase